MNDAFATLQLNLSAVLPELMLVVSAMLIMLIDSLISDERPGLRRALPWLAMAGVISTLVVCFRMSGQASVVFQSAAISDRFAVGLRLVVLTATGLAILLSERYIPLVNKQVGEYYALLMLCAAGMSMMGAASDLIVLFVALEIFSLALYILTGLHRQNQRSTEASMKYFLLGAFASAFLVYGAALIYGATGSTQYETIATVLASGKGDLALLYPGIALLLVGFGFKVSLVPFHMWTPDVYQGAPTPVTAFMSVGTKAAAFAAFARVLVIALPSAHVVWGGALAILAILTMLLGNLAALRQSGLKRMLAYSSIAHAGYILVGLTAGTPASADAVLFYMFTYAFMNIGAFAVVMMIEQIIGEDTLQVQTNGLAERAPLLAFLMAVFMFGLSGMPPLAGFFGKFYVFKAAIDGGWAWLAAIGMLNSAIGAYYYLRVIVNMYFSQPGDETAAQTHSWSSLQLGVAIAAAFTIVVGILPSFWASLFQAGFGGG